MAVENLSQEFRLKNLDKTRNFFFEEINHNKLMSKKHNKVCGVLIYIEHFLILVSTVTRRVCISAFASLVGISITSSAVGLKICVTTAGIKKYKSLNNKKKNKHDKIVLSVKTNLKTIEFLISKVLIDLNITHDEFVSINNVLKEYNGTKEEIKILKT